MTLEERESTEWTNTWIANANTHNRRCLLIGDSVTRQIRGSMERMLVGCFAVDLFAASYSINDSRLLSNIKLFFEDDEYTYDFIILHYGGHHNYINFCYNNKKNYEEYYNNYELLLKYLIEKCHNNIIIMTTNSKTMKNSLVNIDEQYENEIVSRNKIVYELATKYRCNFFDLHGLMNSQKGIYKHRDPSHFTRDADSYISYHILEVAIQNEVISHNIIENQRNINRQKLLPFINCNDKLLIYGMGAVGKEIYWILKLNGFGHNIDSFVISDDDTNSRYEDKPIVSIRDISLEKTKKSVTVIIASDTYENIMKENADKLGFIKIISYKNILNCICGVG